MAAKLAQSVKLRRASSRRSYTLRAASSMASSVRTTWTTRLARSSRTKPAPGVRDRRPASSDDPDFITQDIDAGRLLGTGWFLLDVQAQKLSTEPSWLKVGNSLPYMWTGVSGPDHAGSV